VYNLQIMNSELSLKPKTSHGARYGSSYENYLELHNALTDHREQSGLTQAQVANKLGVSQPAVSNFEGNNSSATMISTLISYAAAVGLEIEFSLRTANYPELPQA
jgi:predicted XRE-type DNA-binding protein